MTLQPKRTVEELRELQRITGNDAGAQRVAWTETWDKARAWMRGKLNELPVDIDTDEAGNCWATLQGESHHEVLIGGHLDSVPSGGWLDGSLNVVGGLEVLRRIAGEGKPPVTIRLVDWADEEGARFGRSLFGSSAASGSMITADLVSLVDRDGTKLTDAISRYGLELASLKASGKQLKNAKAYLELHIEQGPVLESMDLPLAAVLGTFGFVRQAISFFGQSAHAGSTPMTQRRDALGAAAKFALEIREIAKRHGGVCTVGSVVTKPGIPSAVVGQCDIFLDQRHLDAGVLAIMLKEARDACDRFVKEENVSAEWKRILEIPPVLFDSDLIAMCDEAVKETCGSSHRMPSGALHDASETARAGIPTVMMFVQSLRGLSHAKEEDTKDEHLEMSVIALDKLASKTIKWIAARRSV